jgi:hypothetical protein
VYRLSQGKAIMKRHTFSDTNLAELVLPSVGANVDRARFDFPCMTGDS